MQLTFSFIILLLFSFAHAQNSCFSDSFPSPDNPSLGDLSFHAAVSEKTDTFDVVFHIMHLGEPLGQGINITDAQIESAILSLNRDFGGWPIHDSISIHPNGADTKLFFRLACRNPQGVASNGIVRVDARSVQGYETDGFLFIAGNTGNNNQLVSLSRWPTEKYINIWVTHLIQTPFSGPTLGGGFGPGTVIYTAGGGGLYLNHRIVGCDPDRTQGYNIINPYGKIISHEMGHYLGLLHTFQGESCTETNCNLEGDRVCDTEPHNNGRSNDTSCNETIECGTREPIENLMNYSGVLCGNIFTQGQKNRMKTFIQAFLSEVTNQPACIKSAVQDDILATTTLKAYPNPCSEFVWVDVFSNGLYRLVDLHGSTVRFFELTSGKHKLDLSMIVQGIYFLIPPDSLKLKACRLMRI
jgi:hypothetical protein